MAIGYAQNIEEYGDFAIVYKQNSYMFNIRNDYKGCNIVDMSKILSKLNLCDIVSLVYSREAGLVLVYEIGNVFKTYDLGAYRSQEFMQYLGSELQPLYCCYRNGRSNGVNFTQYFYVYSQGVLQKDILDIKCAISL